MQYPQAHRDSGLMGPAQPDARPSAGVPGPPFMPLASTRYDETILGVPQNQRAERGCDLDSIGRTVFKTMPGVVCDEHNAAFLSKENLDAVQAAVARSVLSEAGYAIDRQSDEKILILMRKAYLSNVYARDVTVWNAAVVRDAAKKIITNIKYADIHLKIKEASFTPVAYGISSTASIRGLS
jgi:hypothetical protein